MECRTLGRTGLEVGVIGLGTEHIRDDAGTKQEILRLAVEAGANYVDLLYVEPEYWESYGPLLRPYRDDLILAAHWSSGPEYDLDYCQRTFENILSHVGNDYVEVAMMTMIDDGARKERAWREASLAHLRRYQAQGRVGYIGGSAHDPTLARQAVESGLIDVLMFPVNMVGHDDKESQALLQACAAHDVGVVAMKPYHGSTLFTANGQPSGITPAHCLSYVLSQPVATSVPGPKTVAEWRSTLRYMDATAAEKDYRPVLGDLRSLMAGQCVYCHHCLPCAVDIEIGWVIWHLDQVPAKGAEQVKEWYAEFPVRASACTACGVCLERCPFEVDIVDKMRQAAQMLEG
jgi:hypothetical protein